MLNVDHDFQALELQIKGPSYQQERDTAQLQRTDIAVAPHQRLPTELLSYIFLLITKDLPFKVPLDPDPTPSWTLRHICSRWRNIILDHHNLWSSITVNLDHTDEGGSDQEIVDVKNAARLLDVVLPTVGTISLSVNIDEHFTHIKNAIDTVIAPYSRRLLDLSICLPAHGFNAFSHLLPNQLNSLQSLDIEFLSGDRGQGICDFPSSLRKLTISADIDSCPSISSPQINWNNITDLDLARTYAKFTVIFPILKCCKNIKTCVITVRECNNGPQGQDITLPYLHSFSVWLDNPCFFNSFTLPSLSQLTVETTFCDFPAAGITSMIMRSGCALHELCHRDLERQTTPCDSDALAALLTFTPSLQTLAVRFAIPWLVMKRIGHGGLLSNLENFECTLKAEAGGTFLDAVECRLRDQTNGASNGVLRSAVGIYLRELHLVDDMQLLVDRASHLDVVYSCDVRVVSLN